MGNKRQLAAFIEENIRRYTKECRSCMDLFSGSGSASVIFKRMGYQVYANDFLYFSTILTKAVLLNNEPPAFESIGMDFNGKSNAERYRQVLDFLNNLEGKRGFIFEHYSPAAIETDGVERMYFTKENAKKIDVMRQQIDDWKNDLTDNEFALLLSDLLKAVAPVSNIAGTYGCYMKYWKKRAINPIRLNPAPFFDGCKAKAADIFCERAEKLAGKFYCDIVYADPPYTKRQYGAYYHLLETIAQNDTPKISGTTGLRDWAEKSSDFCYKKRALGALELILSRVKCKYFVMSYNNEGQMIHEKIVELMSKYGNLEICETNYKKYKSNNAVKESKV
ncbi:MAG: DNA adenine methylase, partial [Clostridium sp.]|nr:DNA adenine methylase [Clostridium sp.]